MANYYEKISVLIDVTTDKAVNGFNNFKTAIKDAEGFSGKFKAGVGSLKESLGGLVGGPVGPAAVAGAATAIGAAWIKAGQTFIDTARSARDLSAATGLGIEDASRLIEVFSDLGGDAGSLASSIGKITKSLDDDKWTKYGIATRDASGEARDANDIFLESLEVLRNIQNPTERAAAGTELYGKSWANLAPLIGKSDKALRDALKSVKAGKVITEEEAEKADKLAEGFDNIKDAVEEMVLAAGQALVEMKPIFDAVALTLEAIAYDIGLIMDAWGWLVGPSDEMQAFNEKLKAYNEYIAKMKEVTEKVPPVMTEFGDANKYAAEQAYYAAQEAAKLEQKLANKRGGVAWAAAEAEAKITRLLDAISDDRQWIAVQLGMDGLKERLDELTKQYEDGEIDQREYWLRTRDEILATKSDLVGYLDELEDMDPYLKQRILFEFDQGDIDSVLKIMQDYLDGKKVQVQVGATSVPGMPWVGGTGPKDQPYGTTIIVNGALDPVAVADQIERIMRDKRYRDGQGGF